MEGKDNIKELFSQKLGNYEAPVNPELWAKISSQVAAASATTTAATGLSLFAKIAIGVGVSAAAIATVVVLSTNKTEEIPVDNSTTELKKDTKSSLESLEPDDTSMEQTAALNDTQAEVSMNDDNKNLPAQVSSPSKALPTTREATIPVNGMSLRGTTALKTGATNPEIIEGVHYIGGMQTNGTSSDQGETEVNSTTKTEPIKRFVNVFTPNGDGENDIFYLTSEGLTDFSIVVFDPKGEIVYKSSDPNFKWDGRDLRTNEMVPSGNYMYMVSAYDSDTNPYPIYESLRIISN